MKKKRGSALTMSYKEEYPFLHNPKHSLYVNHRNYKKILRLFFKKLAKELITSGKEIVLPSRLGSLQAMKYKPKRKLVDFNATKVYNKKHNLTGKDKKVIYHRNRVTNGFLPIIHWSKIIKANFKNKRKYAFDLTRPNRRPNEYNKNNPEVSLMPYFKKEGYLSYEIYNPYLKRQIHERNKKYKSTTS